MQRIERYWIVLIVMTKKTIVTMLKRYILAHFV